MNIILRYIVYILVLFLQSCSYDIKECKNLVSQKVVPNSVEFSCIKLIHSLDSLPTPRFNATARDYWGSICLDKKQYSMAMRLFEESAIIYRDLGYGALEANALRNLGRTYLLCSVRDSSFCYYLRALKTVSALDAVLFMDISTEFYEICRNIGNWEEACHQMLLYRKTRSTDERLRYRCPNGLFVLGDDFNYNGTTGLYTLQERNGATWNFELFASEYQKLYHEWCKLDRHIQVVDRELQHKYNNEVLKNENQQMQNQLLKRNIWMLSLGIFLVVIGILGLIGFGLYRRHIRLRINCLVSQLQENEKRLDEGTIVSREERERLLLENNYLTEKIEQLSLKQREKDNWNAYLQKQNVEYSKQLKSITKVGNSLPPEYCLALSQLFLLRYPTSRMIVENNEEWKAIFFVINVLYGDISARLHDKNLSLQEERICYLLHAGFNHKMIAAASNVTVEAISKAKQRMKGKFGLKAGQSLDNIINE